MRTIAFRLLLNWLIFLEKIDLTKSIPWRNPPPPVLHKITRKLSEFLVQLKPLCVKRKAEYYSKSRVKTLFGKRLRYVMIDGDSIFPELKPEQPASMKKVNCSVTTSKVKGNFSSRLNTKLP